MAASPTRAADTTGVAGEVRPATKQFVVRVDRRTGKLVRVFAGDVPKASDPKHRSEIAPLIQQAAKTHNVDPLLVESVIQVESNYNPYAISRAGAEGVMQLMPATARMLGVSNTFDPQQNIEAGVRYLKQLKDLYHDDRLALAAYNAGPGAVEKYKWVPPYRETQNYVNLVGQRYQDAKLAKQAAKPAELVAAPVKAAEPTADGQIVVEEKHPRLEQFVDEYGRLHLSTKRD